MSTVNDPTPGELVTQTALEVEASLIEQVWVATRGDLDGVTTVLGVYQSPEAARERCEENSKADMEWAIYPTTSGKEKWTAVTEFEGANSRWTVLPSILHKE